MIGRFRSSLSYIPEYMPSDVTERLKGTLTHDFYDKFSHGKPKRLKLVDVELPDGNIAEIYFVEPSYQINEQESKGLYEPLLTKELLNQFSTNSVFYDIGSYFGYYSQLASFCGLDDQNISAFEADSDRFAFLEQAHADTDVKTINKFVGERTTTDEISLDDYKSRSSTPTIVKIDVEGGELDALKGMTDILESASPVMYVEMHPQVYSKFNSSVEEIVDLLHKYGYQIQTANHRDDSSWEQTTLQELPKYNPDTEDANSPDNTYLIKANST